MDGTINASGVAADAAQKGGKVTLASGTNAPTQWISAEWKATSSYTSGAQVTDADGRLYTSLMDGNLGHTLTDAAFWQNTSLIAAPVTITRGWTSGNIYGAGEKIIGSDGKIYISKSAVNRGNDPLADNGANWAGTGVTFGALSTATPLPPVWDSLKSYKKGDVVLGSDGSIYVAKKDSRYSRDNARPFEIIPGQPSYSEFSTEDYWTNIGVKPATVSATGAWSSTAVYGLGAQVIGSDGGIYTSLISGSLNKAVPAGGNASWAPAVLKIGDLGISAEAKVWTNAVNYSTGSLVIGTDGMLYRAKSLTNTNPAVAVNAALWTSTGVTTDAIVSAAATNSWSRITAFAAGDKIVGSDGNTYISKRDNNSGSNPVGDTGANWAITDPFAGRLTLGQTAKIDVSALLSVSRSTGQPTVLAATDKTGSITLQTPRSQIDNLSVKGQFAGASEIDVIGNEAYRGVSVLTARGFKTRYLPEAADFMTKETAIKSRFGTDLSSAVHVRPGIEFRTPGSITVLGDSLNPNGLDFSGTTYTGTQDTAYFTANDYARYRSYNTPGTLQGHFGQQLEPLALILRASRALSFGGCSTVNCTRAEGAALTVGSLSDGFSSRAGGGNGVNLGALTPSATFTFSTGDQSFTAQAGLNLYNSTGISGIDQAIVIKGDNGTLNGTVKTYDASTGALTVTISGIQGSGQSTAWTLTTPASSYAAAGASGQAALFDAPGRPGFSAPSSAAYRLTAGASLDAANPLAVQTGATGTLKVAGFTDALPQLYEINGFYNSNCIASCLYFDKSFLTRSEDVGYKSLPFFDTGSLIRTGTGNIDMAAAGNLVLQGATSVIYTAGAAKNISGTSDQPLSGFVQYTGPLMTNSSADVPYGQVLLPSVAFATNGGDLTIDVGGNIKGANSQGYTYEMTAMGSQIKLRQGCHLLELDVCQSLFNIKRQHKCGTAF